MKNVMMAISGAALLFVLFMLLGRGLSLAQTPAEWPDEYVGTWKLTGKDNVVRYYTLFKNSDGGAGSATTTFNPKADGTWEYDPDQEEVRMEWSDGWADVLVKEEKGYTSYGYGPGTDPDSEGDTVTFAAEKVGMDPFTVVGVWKLSDIQGKESEMTLKVDGTALQGEVKGSWTVVGDKLHIQWPDGSTGVLVNENQTYKLFTYDSGVSLSAQPNRMARAERVEAFLRSDMQATEIQPRGGE